MNLGRVKLALAVPTTILLLVGMVWMVGGREGASELAKCAAGDTECIVETAVETAQNNGVPEALSQVKMLLLARADLMRGCHKFSHVLGERFWAEFGDRAVTPGNLWCSYGYVHGLMVGAGQEHAGDPGDVYTKICSAVEPKVSSGCLHGVGHAALLLNGTLEKAFPVCYTLDTDDMRRSCGQGVMMELAMGSETQRLPEEVTHANCQRLADEATMSGCAIAVSTEMVVRGSSVDANCAEYVTTATTRFCRYGFGAGLANSYLSGFRSDSQTAQRQACSSVGPCTEGFGMAAYLFLNSRDKAEELCVEQLGSGALSGCRIGIERTEEIADPLWH